MSRFSLPDHILPYRKVEYIDSEDGYLVWRVGTGRNVEILHFRAYQPGHGVGRKLLTATLVQLSGNPPYHSVFGFTRAVNQEAQQFYAAMGFTLTTVPGVYKDGQAVLFTATYDYLLGYHNLK